MVSFIGKVRVFVIETLSKRWLSTLFLILALDVATFLAFTRTSGTPSFSHQDKVLHALGFAVLTILGHCALHFDFFRSRHSFSLGLASLNAALWALYGIFIELGQKMLGYRQASMGDFLADVIGIFLGTCWVWGWQLFPKDRGREHG